MTAPQAARSFANLSDDRIKTNLQELFGQILGLAAAAVDVETPFLELGGDSLALLRASQTIQDRFGVKIPFRKMLEEVSTVGALSRYIAQYAPTDFAPITPTSETRVEPTGRIELVSQSGHPRVDEITKQERITETPAPASAFDHATALAIESPTRRIADEGSSTDSGALERIFARQIQILEQQMAQQGQIMSMQLDLLSRLGDAAAVPDLGASSLSEKTETTPTVEAESLKLHSPEPPQRLAVSGDEPLVRARDEGEAEVFVPHKPIRAESGKGLTEKQRKRLDSLIERITQKTAGSKRLAQTYRQYLADSRSSAGFRHLWKEMCYPLVVERGQGARIYDVDGNEYIDLTMGFGALMFGHSPDFQVEALHDAVSKGLRLGGQSSIVGQTAKLICELTSVERVAFCNSGTEAVMGALRLARAATARSMIAIFEGSYHGTFDGVMVRPGEKRANGRIEATPLAPGVPRHMIENVLLLGYDDAEALASIEAHAHELAAVLIEPPRSRRPDVQPREFLHKLREITQKAGIVLIFDEVVTGFRFHPGGVQTLFGVQADLVAYGKAIGNGVPIGVVAGKATFMDAVDGGFWNFGDDSYPQAETTFFAGTYFKNPSVIAAVWSVLNHIKECGMQLYEELNDRTRRLADALNQYFQQEEVPFKVLQIGSLFRFQLPARQALLELFYYYLLEKGIYICETRNCFFSTAHTDRDADFILNAVKQIILEMRRDGFLADRTRTDPEQSASSPGDPSSSTEIAVKSSDAPAKSLAPSTSSPVAKHKSFPLTEAQKQLWFLAQLSEEASVAYNLSLTLELRGAFQPEVLRDCFQAVIDNHDALRITFSPEGDRQYVHPTMTLELPLIDVSALPPSERESSGRKRVDSIASQPFDLINGPLVRGCIVKLTPDFHLFAIAAHHTVTDGASLGVLLSELSRRYTAACLGRRPAISTPVQFGEYVQWDIDRLSADNLHEIEKYWLGQFTHPVPPLDLPTDRQRPAAQSFAGARESFSLGPALSARLLRFCTQQGSTPLMLLLSAVNLLLHKLSGQKDVVVGIPTAGQANFSAPLIGYCLNVLPICSRFEKAMSFNEYLHSMKNVLLDAYERQAYPFNLLVSLLGKNQIIERDQSRPPLISVMFNLDRAGATPQFESVSVNLAQNTTGTAQFDLDINVRQTNDDFHFDCDFGVALFDRTTIRRWLSHLENLLEEIVANPESRLDQFQLLEQTDRQQILYDWNSTAAAYPKQEGVAALFEEQVSRTPASIAVNYADTELTYAELNRRANRLAWRLLDAGVGPEAVVALLSERTPELLISILAVLKAGGAYLPLDPLHPPQRLAQLLKQSKASLVLTAKDLKAIQELAVEGLPPAERPATLTIEEAPHQSGKEADPLRRTEPENLAYLIFTSGSTGAPKGAMIVQQGMVNHLFAKVYDLELGASDVVAQTASQCFDISVWQFLAPLLVGAQVCIMPDEVVQDPRTLAKEIERREVSILEVVPSLLQAVLNESKTDVVERMGGLRWLLATGEALPTEVCRQWVDCRPGVPIMNAYGPTECSDDVTHHVIDQMIPAESWNVPIGRPIANTKLFILNGRLEPEPVGVRGELFVAGDGVGRGYLGRADATAERFVPNPFVGRIGERLYHTGDVARYLSDGEIEFLGRTDHQVKVRGHRIELGEIEHALGQHASVRQSAVVVREDTPGEKRIVAYYVAENSGSSTPEELREHLRARLPDYMTPAAFVLLTEFPLTPNGKLNRKALPAPDGGWMNSVEYEAPRTELEKVLAEIWRDTLRVERVGVRDNFFELGGDSITSMRVVGLARARGVELSPAELFRHQTIAQLVDAIRMRNAPDSAPQEAATGSMIETRHAWIDETTLARLKKEYQQLVDVYPLSPAQQGMLFHHLYNPDSAAYFEQISWTLRGDLNLDVLRRAWLKTIERHPALRTAFVWEGLEDPIQVVCDEMQLEMEVLDWRAMQKKEQQTRLPEYLRKDRERRFDLKHVPLRLALIQLDEETHQLIWSYHHILLDGWAVMQVLREVFTVYDAYSRGLEPALAPSRPFGEYIGWLQHQDLSEAETFWRRTLSGVQGATSFGLDKVQGDLNGREEFESKSINLSAAITTDLQTLARRHWLTMSALIQGAWALLLSRYSGRQDVVFGTVVSGRPPDLTGAESMVGLFINTLPTRMRVEPGAEAIEWLQNLQAWQAEARRYEHSPLALVQTWSGIERGTPLFESIVAFENYAVGHESLLEQNAEFKIANVEVVERVNYPLFLVVGPGTELHFSLHYDARRFGAETIERLLNQLKTLLEGLAANPRQRLGELSLLTPAEERRMLIDWNATEAAYPRGMTVAQLFEEQAARTPDAVAAVFEGDRLSYRELNRRANQLAHFLRKQGVGPETLVGLCGDRSLEMVVGLLGVLKAGGAYTPLDPTYPADRLAYMLRDARLSALLTQQTLSESLPPEASMPRVCLDTDWPLIANEQTGNPAPLAADENLAYVIYTSGSTGAPKGVQLPHRSLVNLLYDMQRRLEFNNEDNFAAVTSISFDIAGLEIFLPLITGATVEIVSRIVSADGKRLAERLAASGASVLQATPTTWQLLLEAGWVNSAGVKSLCGGEAFPRGLATKLLEGEGPVWNLYGPTETTIWSTAWQFQSRNEVITIGRPIANTQIYIVDINFRPSPVGVPGELFIGGDGVGRGYWGRADATAERFVPNPFGRSPDDRLYRTGDVARYLPGGEIEFLGRVDHQVKVRGHRIELGEIENALGQHASVRRSAVVVREDEPGEKRIVAYYSITGGEATGSEELREHLQSRLPAYMIPNAFVGLAEFPLTPNGKIARKSLPAPETGRASKTEYEAPRTELEAILTDVWREALRVERVSVRDNFFDLGGDSILSMRTVSRARARGLEVSPAELFQHQTVADLAAAIQIRQGLLSEPAPVSGLIPLTPIQHWFFGLNQSAPHHFNQAVMLETPPEIEPEALARAAEELITRHDALRVRFNDQDGRRRQIFAGTERAAVFTMHDLSDVSDAELGDAIERSANEVQASLNLSDGPLFRAVFLKLHRPGSKRSNRLLLAAHHLTVDLSSWRILLEDFQTIYRCLSRGETPPPLPASASFGRWAEMLSEWADSDESLSEADHWLDQSRAGVAALPIDYEKGLNLERWAGVLITTMSESDTEALLHKAPKAFRATPNETLLTALALAVVRWSGQDKILVDVEGHGREDLFPKLDLSRTVGWFTSLYPLLIDLSQTISPQEALKVVKEQVRATPRGGVGYGALKYLSRREQIASQLQAMPSAEICFNYIGPSAAAGRSNGEIRLAKENPGRLVSEQNLRPYRIMVSGQVENRRLSVHWMYGKKIHRKDTIRRLAGYFKDAFQDLMACSEQQEGSIYTPSDFPNANLSQTELDEFLSSLSAVKGAASE